jgi:hypothetical protein
MRLIRTIDNHKDIEKILAVAFTVDCAVNDLNTGCATLEDCLTWYRVIAIVRAGSKSAFAGRCQPMDIGYSRGDQSVQLEGPIRSVGEYDILRRKVVAAGHIKPATRVR